MPATDPLPGRRATALLLGFLLALCVPALAQAKYVANPPPQERPDPGVVRDIALPDHPRAQSARTRGLHRSGPPVEEVYVFVDSLDGRPLDDDAGWDHVDRSEQPTAWHIDSLLACEGKAWWCGVVDSSWIYDSNRAGYDNNWVYDLVNLVDISAVPANQTLRLNFRQRLSVEPYYDQALVEVLDPTEDWTLLTGWTGEIHGQDGDISLAGVVCHHPLGSCVHPARFHRGGPRL